jgi:hypothetical protein
MAVLALVCAVSYGCTQAPHSGATSPSDAQLLEIARKAVAQNDTWVDQAEFQDPIRAPDGSGWSVLVWRLPKTPGGFRLIRIDDRGQVTSYVYGH